LVAILADQFGSWRLVLASCAASAAGAALALIWARPFWLLLLVALMQAAALAPTTSIADALAVSIASPRMVGRPFGYGWVRGSASAAFVAGTLIVGQLIRPDDLTPVIWMNAAFLIAASGATALVPGVTNRIPLQRLHSSPLVEVKALFRIPQFRSVILVSSMVYGSHGMHDAFAVILWSDAGISASVISVLWSEAVLVEVLVFSLIGPAVLDQFGTRWAAVLAALAGLLRWTVASGTTSVLALSLIQPLHGLTFALLHLACMRIMADVVPKSVAAGAQGLYALGSGLVTAALTLLSGSLYASFTGAGFLAMAILCAIALPFAWTGFNDRRARLEAI
jgi:PPP family 3-phenylpropionic acid transporter